MSSKDSVPLTLLGTGVAGLDEVIGGGLPEYSFNLVAGAPGSGKTTLIHQLLFANATVERPALFFTVLGEPALKMLRYQQQMSFFDVDKVGSAIRFVDLGAETLAGDLAGVLERIRREVKEVKPAFVVVDSFRSVIRGGQAGPTDLQSFVQQLAVFLTSWQTTSFLVGEYVDSEVHDNPVFTIADGILWLSQHVEGNAVVRKLRVIKMRGVAPVAGVHTLRISSSGVQLFPRSEPRLPGRERFLSGQRDLTGIPGLDAILGGGFPAGDATLVAGPSGTGKTVMGMQFVVEGIKQGAHGVLAIFEENGDDYAARGRRMGFDLEGMAKAGSLELLALPPLDLSSDEILHDIQRAVTKIGAKRLVIDSINGLEIVLAPNHREEFRESLFRMIRSLTGGGVSVLLTIEIAESFTEVKFSPHAVSFLAQNIIFLRYAEIDGELRKIMAVIKMRNSGHSRELHGYEITATGLRVLGPLDQYEGLLSGLPRRRPPAKRVAPPGVTADEALLLERLIALQRATELVLSEGSSLSEDNFARAVQRLIGLGYAVRTMEDGESILRPAPGLRRR